jgi:hypothetical protein
MTSGREGEGEERVGPGGGGEQVRGICGSGRGNGVADARPVRVGVQESRSKDSQGGF